MRTALNFTHALSPLNSLHPFGELSLVKDYFERGERGSVSRAGFHPACDIEETEAAYLVSFDLPGVAKEHVQIEIEDDELRVSGERPGPAALQDGEPPRGRYHFAERTLGKFQRVFTLPTAVKAEAVEAKFAHGVLEITLPKAESAKPRKIAIQA